MATVEEAQQEIRRREAIAELKRRKVQSQRQTITEGQVVDFGDGPVQMRDGQLVAIPQSEAAAIQAQQAQPSAREITGQTLENLGLDPTLERSPIVPVARDPATGEGEFAAPEVAVDILRGFLAPGSVFKGGDPKISDVLQFLEASAPGAVGARAVSRRVGTVPGSKAPGAAVEPVVPAPEQTSVVKRIIGVPGEAPQNIEQAARAKRFEDLGIVATKGDITQDFAQQATEQRLLGRVTSEAAEPLRQKKLVQSNQFKARVDELVKGLGVPERLGDAVKKVLTGEKAALKKEKNRLYKAIAKESPKVLDTPLFTNAIEDAVPDATLLRRIRRLSPTIFFCISGLKWFPPWEP